MPNISEDSVSSLSDEQLIENARKYDGGTAHINSSRYISVLILRYMAFIKYKAKSMAGASADYEDLISEGFMGFISAIHSYNLEKSKFSTYANICITNRMKTLLTSQKSTLQKAEDYDLTTLKDDKILAEELLINKENESEIVKILEESLSKRELQVLLLYVNACTYTMISEKLGISIKSVDNSLTRARQKLKAKLNPRNSIITD